MLTNKDLDEMEAQLDSSVPYYVPALITEIRRLRATALGGASPAEPRCLCNDHTGSQPYAACPVHLKAHVPSPVSSTGAERAQALDDAITAIEALTNCDTPTLVAAREAVCNLLRDSSPRTGAQDVAAGTVHLRCPCGQEIDLGTTQPITVRWLTARRDSSPRTGSEGWQPQLRALIVEARRKAPTHGVKEWDWLLEELTAIASSTAGSASEKGRE